MFSTSAGLSAESPRTTNDKPCPRIFSGRNHLTYDCNVILFAVVEINTHADDRDPYKNMCNKKQTITIVIIYIYVRTEVR